MGCRDFTHAMPQRWTRRSILSTRVRLRLARMSATIFDASALTNNNSNHCPCANLVNRFKSLFIGTFPPPDGLNNNILERRMNSFHPLVILTWLSDSMPEVISCNASRIEDRYAPRKNAGGTFITHARCVKMSNTLIKSRATKPACVSADGRTSHASGRTMDSASTRESVDASPASGPLGWNRAMWSHLSDWISRIRHFACNLVLKILEQTWLR